jgi:hypothetical protein
VSRGRKDVVEVEVDDDGQSKWVGGRRASSIVAGLSFPQTRDPNIIVARLLPGSAGLARLSFTRLLLVERPTDRMITQLLSLRPLSSPRHLFPSLSLEVAPRRDLQRDIHRPARLRSLYHSPAPLAMSDVSLSSQLVRLRGRDLGCADDGLVSEDQGACARATTRERSGDVA